MDLVISAIEWVVYASMFLVATPTVCAGSVRFGARLALAEYTRIIRYGNNIKQYHASHGYATGACHLVRAPRTPPRMGMSTPKAMIMPEHEASPGPRRHRCTGMPHMRCESSLCELRASAYPPLAASGLVRSAWYKHTDTLTTHSDSLTLSHTQHAHIQTHAG